MKKYFAVSLLLILSNFFPNAVAQQSGTAFYRSGLHNANRVKTVFGNWGVIGQPNDTRPRGAWIYNSNGYIGDVSLFVGAEVKSGVTKFHSVVTCPVSRPRSSPDESPLGEPWTFLPQSGYFNPNQGSIAMSDDKNSYPTLWPDKMNDANDPGWKDSWNGYFGKRASANQESYFVMDDNNDKRFYSSDNNTLGVSFKPDANDSTKAGLGLEVRVRGMQWAQFLAQDNIFWLYEITNTSTTTYDRVVFGMLVGTYVGVTANSSIGNEYDDDWSFYDVNENITYTGDFTRDNSRNPFWVGPVGMVGYAFLESPGNPFDGIDNDDDVDRWVSGSTLPAFKQSDFDSVLIKAGDKVVLINDDFSRRTVTVPAGDTIFHTRGADIAIKPGITKLSEGGLVVINGNETVNPNAYDGIDNDLDGLIDENFYLHFHQIKKSDDVPPKILIDKLRPVRHQNYFTSSITDPYSMVDERRDDLIDNDKDWNFSYDDVGRDGVSNSQDFGERDGNPTSGYLASGFDTGLPGEPNMDKTDVDESDQIGLTSFQYFTPANDVPLGEDEKLWTRLSPGFFAVPKSIVSNQPERGEDGDFIYGSGYFPLVAKKTERFSLALVYGGGNGGSRQDDIDDLLKHKQTVQKIYDANYQFPIPPDPAPTLSAVAGDKFVHLYWDRKSEEAFDPVLRVKDFQGYKIYKATDREFNDVFNVTNANGIKKGYSPKFQFDLRDSVQGYFRAPSQIFQSAEGFTYNLGTNTGLVHDTIDADVVNGRTYYYVIVAYDNGDEVQGIFPSENSWKINIDQTGRITNTTSNVVIVTPNVRKAGFMPRDSGKALTTVSSFATGSVAYRVVDEMRLTGGGYEVSFVDTRDSGLFNPKTTLYSVKDTSYYTEIFQPNKIDTIITNLIKSPLVPGTVTIYDLDGSVVSPTRYIVNTERGAIRAKNLRDLQSDTISLKKYKVQFKYYPVYKSPYINRSPYVKETKDTDIFDGVQLIFNNDWFVNLVDTLSGFNSGKRSYPFDFSAVNLETAIPPIMAIPYASDYDIIFSNSPSDTSLDYFGEIPKPINFKVWNRTDKKSVKVIFGDNDGNGVLNALDQVLFFEKNDKDSVYYTWFLTVKKHSNVPDDKLDTVYTFGNGDTLKIRTTKPFRHGDIYTFGTVKPTINEAKASEELSNIRVVPNPYVVQSNLEQPNVPGVIGHKRKIEFRNLPVNAKISIFTARGDLVRTLYSDGSLASGTVSWDVKSKENLDIAYGVYFYVVESSVGSKSGKIAIIK